MPPKYGLDHADAAGIEEHEWPWSSSGTEGQTSASGYSATTTVAAESGATKDLL